MVYVNKISDSKEQRGAMAEGLEMLSYDAESHTLYPPSSKWFNYQQKKKHTLASMTPDNNRAPIVSNIVPTTNNVTARAIALVGNFGGGFSN